MRNYSQSNMLLSKVEKIIPLASQTFSKSHYSLPKGAAPLFIDKADGAKIWDVDGNEYIDLVNGLLSVSLGYKDEDVDQAIKDQLNKGINFSLSHTLEYEVSKLLIDLIPCAEMVRFGKNGSDVTTAAIRLARAYTGREHVAVCGYHGWQDWYIGSTSRNLGVPKAVQCLTHTFKYNDIKSLEALFSSFPDMAAVILEPMSSAEPVDGFLNQIRKLCDANGAILIFDEMITGFRFHLNGAQGLFGVTPDLATFGKGMSNGMPLSSIVGKKEIMNKMEDIFFSGTFGGETLSLAAAKATINKIMNSGVISHIQKMGSYLMDGVSEIIKNNNVTWLSLVGHESWKIIIIDAGDNTPLYKSLFLQEMIANGVLTIGSHNLSYAFKKEHADKVLIAYEKTIKTIEKYRLSNNESDLLHGEMIKPVFSVR